MYQTDKPIENAEMDKLGRKNFASRLADAICKYQTTDHYVVALQGKWGCGKTSVINMTLEELRKRNEDEEMKKKIILVRFEPWNFTDTSQLLNQFFVTLMETMNLSDEGTKLKKVGEELANYSSALESMTLIPEVGKWIGILAQLGKGAGKAISATADARAQDIAAQRKKVEEELKKVDERILIVIDDIDRLPNDQIRLIFQLVNAVAGFPNTTYLLSFDREIVSRALGEQQNCDGYEYLEKFVQFPFEMPAVDGTKLRKILMERLKTIWEETNPQEKLDGERLYETYSECVFPFVENLRDVNRMVNAMTFSYSAVCEEVDFMDMMGICALQVFAPEAYDWVRENKDLLTGAYLRAGGSEEKRKEQHQKMEEQLKECCGAKAAKAIRAVEELFPAVSGRILYDTTRVKLHQERRVADPQKFDLYFSLAVEDVKIGRVGLDNSLMRMDAQELRSYLDELEKQGYIGDYCEELDQQISRIPQERIAVLVPVLVEKFSRIKNTEKDTPFVFRRKTLSVYTIRDILFRQEDEKKRFDLIRKLFETEDLTEFQYLLRLLRTIEYSYGRTADATGRRDYTLVQEDDLQQLEQLFVQRLRYFSDKVPVMEWEEGHLALTLWALADENTYKDYTEQVMQKPEAALYFLSSWITQWENGSGFVTRYEWDNLFPAWIDAKEAENRIEHAVKTEQFWTMPESVQKKLAAFSIVVQGKEKQVAFTEVDEKMQAWTEEFEKTAKKKPEKG